MSDAELPNVPDKNPTAAQSRRGRDRHPDPAAAGSAAAQAAMERAVRRAQAHGGVKISGVIKAVSDKIESATAPAATTKATAAPAAASTWPTWAVVGVIVVAFLVLS